jgi:hypothetical protein
MSEVIAFPNTDEVTEVTSYHIVDAFGDQIYRINYLVTAKAVARLLAEDWPGIVFAVEDNNGDLLFTVLT